MADTSFEWIGLATVGLRISSLAPGPLATFLGEDFLNEGPLVPLLLLLIRGAKRGSSLLLFFWENAGATLSLVSKLLLGLLLTASRLLASWSFWNRLRKVFSLLGCDSSLEVVCFSTASFSPEVLFEVF